MLGTVLWGRQCVPHALARPASPSARLQLTVLLWLCRYHVAPYVSLEECPLRNQQVLPLVIRVSQPNAMQPPELSWLLWLCTCTRYVFSVYYCTAEQVLLKISEVQYLLGQPHQLILPDLSTIPSGIPLATCEYAPQWTMQKSAFQGTLDAVS